MIRMLVSIALLFFSPALAGESAEEPQYEMVEYQFVLLWPATNGPDPADPAMADVFQQHIRYLGQLSAAGRVLAAGPLIDDGRPVGGAVILDAGSVEQAEQLLADDPTVLRGILTIEAHPLWAAKGILQRPGSFDDFTQHSFLGLLRRPIDAPEFDDETLQEMQRGHLGNMEVMHQAGELVIAGPMGDDTALRGILVFRTVERDRVLELVARDPSVKARRLEVELYEWRLFKGTLPPASAR